MVGIADGIIVVIDFLEFLVSRVWKVTSNLVNVIVESKLTGIPALVDPVIAVGVKKYNLP